MTRVLMVGLSAVFVRLVDGHVPDRSIVVLEEPDLISRRGLGSLPEQYACVAAIVPATYQQGGNHLEVAADVHARTPVDAVLPSLEYSVPAAAEVAAMLGLPGAGVRAAAVLRDKLLLREVTAAAGMRAPRWSEVDGPGSLLAFAGDGAVVVKPADRQASLGVHVLERVTPEVAERVWSAVRSVGEAGVPDREMRRRYLVEERLVGPEYSVEAIVSGGVTLFANVTAKRVEPGEHPVETGHVLPAPLPPEAERALRDATGDLVAALGFGTGILHAEWILTADGPTLVECAGRCPGDHLMMLLDLAYGMDSRPQLIRMHAGHVPDLPAAAGRCAAIEFARVAPGRVVGIDGVEEARAMPGVQYLRITAQVGDEARPWASSWDRVGYAVAVGADAAQATARAARAVAAVRVRTDG